MESSSSVDCSNSGEVQNFAMDSTRWAGFPYRSGDIVIASWARSGTTWLQQIVAQLLLGPKADLNLERLSPWVEHRVMPLPLLIRSLESQQHRRFLKTHLPADVLPMSDKARYLFIGRDGRDVAISLYNFHKSHTPLAYRIIKKSAGDAIRPLVAPNADFEEYFDEWLEKDGYPWWPYWSCIRSWWALRSLKNVCLVHYRDLSTDLGTEMRRIAEFLELEIQSDTWAELIELCTFGSMRSRSGKLFGRYADNVLHGGLQSFFRKGTSDQWRTLLSSKQIERYEMHAVRELGDECAQWLAGQS
jgi:aryl sulfotransferase